MTINSLVFRLTGSTTIASAFATPAEKATCPVKLSNNYSAEIIVPRDKAD